jgi:hypothetical protein
VFKAEVFSVRDSESRGFLTDDSSSNPTNLFPSLEAVRVKVPRLLRGQSAYWQVRVVHVDAPDAVVMFGFRAGPGGTGERWTWRDA